MGLRLCPRGQVAMETLKGVSGPWEGQEAQVPVPARPVHSLCSLLS